MTSVEAAQIANLLNDRNELDHVYTEVEVLEHAGDYEYEKRDGSVIACIERVRVQWYQWEIRHLSVAANSEGKGRAFVVYQRAESAAQKGGARILQCTIRRGNERSEKFFRRQGYTEVNTFQNHRTGNAIGVWQKLVTPSP